MCSSSFVSRGGTLLNQGSVNRPGIQEFTLYDASAWGGARGTEPQVNRNELLGGDADRTDGDLASEVRSKLEANLPASQLTVEADDGAVEVTGTVPTQEQLDRIEPLAREIKGVQNVSVNVNVAPAQPQN